MSKPTKAVVVKPDATALRERLRVADAINVYAAFKRADNEAAFYALQLGIYLEWVKPQLEHGEFDNFKTDVLRISAQHGRRFQESARLAMKQKELMGLKPQALLGEGGAKQRKAAEQMLMDFIDGRSQAQLFNDLKGIKHKSGPLSQEEKVQEIRNHRRDLLVNLRESCERVVKFKADLSTDRIDTACARLITTLETLTGVAWSPDPAREREALEFKEHAHVYE